MTQQPISLEQLAAVVNDLRQKPGTRRRFPQAFWDAVFRLAETQPLKKICQELHLNPVYVQDKIRQTQSTRLEFREISPSVSSAEMVTIELSVGSDVKAKIQGPVSCLDHLRAMLWR